MDGYEPVIRTVEIDRAQKKVEEFRLARNVGVLEVMVKPNGVSVLVDGVKKGTVLPGPSDPMGTLSLELPVGEHIVAIQLKGYGPVEKRVTIQKGGTLTLKEILKRAFMADTRVTMTTGEVLTGVLGEKLPNGDLKLETQLGIYKTLASAQVVKVEPIAIESAK